MFFKICVLKNFVNFTGLRPATLLKKRHWKRATLLKKTPTQGFSCEICELFKNTFLCRTHLVAASVACNNWVIHICQECLRLSLIHLNLILKLNFVSLNAHAAKLEPICPMWERSGVSGVSSCRSIVLYINGPKLRKPPLQWNLWTTLHLLRYLLELKVHLARFYTTDAWNSLFSRVSRISFPSSLSCHMIDSILRKNLNRNPSAIVML